MSGVRCQVSGVRCQVSASSGLAIDWVGFRSKWRCPIPESCRGRVFTIGKKESGTCAKTGVGCVTAVLYVDIYR